ncbi:hypothetical protein [Rossellomorea sp. NPDC077527]|uniref:hypothetical protein n=1 Tax=Rossellomorea sp. NPDC077527 TaxID=3364510 RepID=UPI0037C63E5A
MDDACQFSKWTPATYERGGENDEDIWNSIKNETKMAFFENSLQPCLTARLFRLPDQKEVAKQNILS